MNTIIFITGEKGVGKTSFISKHFANREIFFVLDLCAISQSLFGTLEAFEDDRLADIYNQATEEAMDALMEGKVLVIEYGLSGYDEDLVALVKAAKSNGFRVEVNQVVADKELVDARMIPTGKVDGYLPFGRFRADLLEILAGIVECMGFDQNWERVCHFSGPGVAVDFFRTEEDGRSFYFYLTEQNKYFVFDLGEIDTEFAGVEVVHRYPSFSEAIGALQEKTPLAGLYPSHIRDGYLKVVKDAYQQYLSPTLDIKANAWAFSPN